MRKLSILGNDATPLERWVFAAAIGCVVVLYVGLFGHYRLDNMDDPWSLSFVYNYIHKGIEHDFVFADGHEEGRWMSMRVFGKTHAAVYGAWLNLAGWTRDAAHLLSIALMVVAAFMWRAMMRRIGFNARAATAMALLLLLVEPFYGAANQARPDALIFMLLAICGWMAARGWLVASGVVAGVAMETHPIAVAVFPLVAAVWLAQHHAKEQGWSAFWRAALRAGFIFVAGLLPMALYYLYLHGEAVSQFMATVKHGNSNLLFGDNIVFQYFCMTKYLRHLPELAGIFLCLVMFWRWRAGISNPFGILLTSLTLLLLVAIRRPNFMYMIFFYAGFLVVMIQVFAHKGRLAWLLLAWLLFLMPQYAWVYKQHRHIDLKSYIETVKKHVPATAMAVIGSPNDWYAFKERDFVILDYRGTFEKLEFCEFVVIEDEGSRRGEYPKLSAFLARHNVKVLDEFAADGLKRRILLAKRR